MRVWVRSWLMFIVYLIRVCIVGLEPVSTGRMFCLVSCVLYLLVVMPVPSLSFSFPTVYRTLFDRLRAATPTDGRLTRGDY